jgi:RNA polymerase sigma factor (sigma-70 family)
MTIRAPARDSQDPAFTDTRWSIVRAARSDSPYRGAALEQLCSTYWFPIYCYLRRRGHNPHDAEDLTQSFFLHLTHGGFLDRPDPEKGRFRGYLVGALRHFLGTHFERENARKRGGGASFIDWTTLDAEREFASLAQPEQDPSALYETSWALTLLGQALSRLEKEQQAADKAEEFRVLKQFLSTTPTRGDYAVAAQTLGTSRTTVAVWVHRLTQRYAELVKLEVAATLQDPAEVKHEMQHLLEALRR